MLYEDCTQNLDITTPPLRAPPLLLNFTVCQIFKINSLKGGVMSMKPHAHIGLMYKKSCLNFDVID